MQFWSPHLKKYEVDLEAVKESGVIRDMGQLPLENKQVD